MGRKEDLELLEHCIELAWQARTSSRRPFVGALITNQEGEILAGGYKKPLPETWYQIHAERDAIARAQLHPLWEKGKSNRKLVLYSTLEPCTPIKDSRRKQQNPPILKCCADLIIEAGISKVVVGVLDNSVGMAPGQGLNYLKQRGVEVEELYDTRLREKIKRLMGIRYALPHKFELVSAQEEFEENIRKLRRALN